jgi:hypothetical protein
MSASTPGPEFHRDEILSDARAVLQSLAAVPAGSLEPRVIGVWAQAVALLERDLDEHFRRLASSAVTVASTGDGPIEGETDLRTLTTRLEQCLESTVRLLAPGQLPGTDDLAALGRVLEQAYTLAREGLAVLTATLTDDDDQEYEE